MKDVTVIIPTYNRSKLFQDIIQKYVECDIKSPILIGDSSGYSHSVDYKDLNVNIIDYPEDTDVFDKFADISKYVETKYCIISADDDRLKWRFVKKYRDFLHNNSDFVMAMGRMSANKHVSITNDIPEERYLQHLGDYTPTVYGLYLSDIFKEIWTKTRDTKLESVWCELYASALVSISGKIKFFDEWFIERPNNNGLSKNCKRLYDYVSDGTYKEMYKKFSDGLICEIPSYMIKKGWNSYTKHYHWFIRDRIAYILRRMKLK